MLGRRTLLLNPPLINGIAFTRQGRCQEQLNGQNACSLAAASSPAVTVR